MTCSHYLKNYVQAYMFNRVCSSRATSSSLSEPEDLGPLETSIKSTLMEMTDLGKIYCY